MSAFGEGELHHKMSKKIAQLTKVIFHLNTRNEDAKNELDASRFHHRQEIEQMTKDAATKMNALKMNIEKKEKLLEATDDIKRVKSRHQKEKQEAFDAFSRYKEECKNRQMESKKMFQLEVERLNKEVDSIKQKFKAEISRMKVSSNSMKQQHENSQIQLEELKKKHAGEISDLVLSSNEKYNTMLASQLNQQDVLRVELEKDREMQLAKLKEHFQDEKQELIRQYETQHSEALQHQEKQGTAAIDSVKREYVSKMEQLLCDLEDLRAQETKLRTEKQNMQKVVSEQADKINDLDTSLKRSSNALKDLSDASNRDATQQELQLKQSNERRKELQKELEYRVNDIKALQKQLMMLEKELSLKNKAHTEASCLLEEKEKRLATSLTELNKATVEIANLNALLHDTHASREQFNEEQKEAMKLLEEKLSRQTEELADALEIIRKLEDAKKDLENSYIGQLEQKSAEHEKKLLGLEQSFKEKMQVEAKNLNESLSALSEKAGNEHKREVERIQKEHEEECRRLNKELTALQTTSAAKSSDLEKRLEAASRELNEHKASIKNKGEEYGNQINKLKAELGDAKNQRLSSESLHKKKIEQITVEWKNKLAGKELHYQNLLKSQKDDITKCLTADFHKKKREIEEAFENEKQSLEDGIKDITEKHSTVVSELIEELEGVKAELEQTRTKSNESRIELRESFNSKIKQTELEWTSKIDSMILEHRDAIQLLNSENEEQLLELEHQSEQALNNLKKEKRLETKQALDVLREELQKKLQEAENEAQRHLNAELQNADYRHKEELKQQIHTLQNEKMREMSEQKHDFGNQLMQLQSQLTSSHEEIQLKKQSELQLTQEVVKLKATVAAQSKEMIARASLLRNEHEEAITLLKKKTQADMDKLLEEQMNATQLLNEQFESTKNILQNEVDGLKHQVCVAEAKYAARESRPEDIARIEDLENEVFESSAMIKQTQEEMAYFKRELLNREETYNKTFSRSPNVGVLQVLKSASPVIPNQNQSNHRHVRPSMKPQKIQRARKMSQQGANGNKSSLPPLGSINNNQNNSYRDLRGQI